MSCSIDPQSYESARSDSPGPHLGLLRSLQVSVPSRLDEWVRHTLSQALLAELDSLLKRMRVNTPRLRNRRTPLTPESPVVSLFGEHDAIPTSKNHQDRLIITLPRAGATEDDPADPASSGKPNVDRVDLSDFPNHLRPQLFQTVSDLLDVERTHAIRSVLVGGAALSKEALGDLVGRPPERVLAGPAGLSGRRIALTFSPHTARSALSTPAMIALLRWRLYSGAGWTATPM